MMNMSTGNDAERSRLEWQCRRGMRELDELLRCFLLKRYSALDVCEQRTFSVLLEYPDSVLLELLMGRITPADRDVEKLVRDIRDTAQT
jgi:antitoxin CptB